MYNIQTKHPNLSFSFHFFIFHFFFLNVSSIRNFFDILRRKYKIKLYENKYCEEIILFFIHK